jgi:chromosome segregation ATPase
MHRMDGRVSAVEAGLQGMRNGLDRHEGRLVRVEQGLDQLADTHRQVAAALTAHSELVRQVSSRLTHLDRSMEHQAQTNLGLTQALSTIADRLGETREQHASDVETVRAEIVRTREDRDQADRAILAAINRDRRAYPRLVAGALAALFAAVLSAAAAGAVLLWPAVADWLRDALHSLTEAAHQ